MAQQAVETYGWLSAGEMLDGLGLAETTPGPLILVTEFVGFLAGYRYGGDPKLVFGLLGAAITLWATFAPCFLWIFAGAPYVERLSANPRLAGALSAVTAAVVGVILNLSLWFALHVFFAKVEPVWHGPLRLWLPDLSTLDIKAVVLSALRGASAAQVETRHRCHARDFRGRGACLVRAVWNVAVLSRAEPRDSRTAPAPTCRDGPNRPERKAPRPRCRAAVSTSVNGARTYVPSAAIISGAGSAARARGRLGCRRRREATPTPAAALSRRATSAPAATAMLKDRSIILPTPTFFCSAQPSCLFLQYQIDDGETVRSRCGVNYSQPLRLK